MPRRERLHQIVLKSIAAGTVNGRVSVDGLAAQYPELQPDLADLLIGLMERRSPTPESEGLQLLRAEGSDGGCPTSAAIEAFVAGTLSAEHLEFFQAHIDGCDRCAAELDELLDFQVIADEEPSDSPEVKRRTPVDVPQYEFVEFLDSGSQGEVWLVRYQPLDQLRAAKFFLAHAIGATERERLRRETRVMSALGKHPNRVMLFDFLDVGTHYVLVMEYIDGGSMKRQCADGPFAWPDALRYTVEVGEGLLEMHRQGIIHRDIKPGNILVDSRSRSAVLCDFGLSEPAVDAFEVVGTAGYAAPELILQPATERSDVFSLAATLYYLVVGRAPFDTKQIMSSLLQARAGLSDSSLLPVATPEAVRKLILYGLNPNPDDRPDLLKFIAAVRAAKLQSLADALIESNSAVAVRLDVEFVRRADAASKPETLPYLPMDELPELKVLGWSSDWPIVRVNTGDLITVSIRPSRAGYLQILNLGSAGEVATIFPSATPARQAVNPPLQLSFLVSPPDGVDRLAVVWSSQPIARTAEEWHNELSRARVPVAGHVRSLEVLPPANSGPSSVESHTVVIGLVHGGALSSLRRGPADSAVAIRSLSAPTPTVEIRGETIASIEDSETSAESESRYEIEMPTCIAAGGSATLRLRTGGRMERGLSACITGDLTDGNPIWMLELESGNWCMTRLNLAANYTASAVTAYITFVQGPWCVPIRRLSLHAAVVDNADDGARIKPHRISGPLRRYRRTHLINHPEDAPSARIVGVRVREAGAECDDTWIALTPEERWHKGIARRAEMADAIIILWSPHLWKSILSMEEVRHALRLQGASPNSPIDVIPIRVSDVAKSPTIPVWKTTWGHTWPALLRLSP